MWNEQFLLSQGQECMILLLSLIVWWINVYFNTWSLFNTACDNTLYWWWNPKHKFKLKVIRYLIAIPYMITFSYKKSDAMFNFFVALFQEFSSFWRQKWYIRRYLIPLCCMIAFRLWLYKRKYATFNFPVPISTQVAG